MLKKSTVKSLPLLMLMVACETNASSIRYCNSGNTTSLLIDFSKRRIVITDAGQSDQMFSIAPCGASIRDCFMGEISYINPYKVSTKENSNVISLLAQNADSQKVVLEGSGSRVSYEMKRSDTFPTAMILTDRKSNGERFTLCS